MSFYSFPKHKRVAEKAGRFMATLKTAPSTSPDFYKRKQEQVRRIAEKIGERERREFRKNRAFVDGKARPSQDYVDSVKKQFWEDYEQGKIPKSTNVNKTANDVKKGPTPEYQEFLDWKKSNTSSPTPTVDVKPATNQPSPQRTPKSFAEELASGKNLNSPEDLQFYQNNASAIEKELADMAKEVKDFKDKDTISDEPKTSQKPSEPEVATKTTEPEKPTATAEPVNKPADIPEPGKPPKPTDSPKPAAKSPASILSRSTMFKAGAVGVAAAGLYYLLKPSQNNKQVPGVLTNNSVNDTFYGSIPNNFNVSRFATGNASVRRMRGSGPVHCSYDRRNFYDKRVHGSRSMGGY